MKRPILLIALIVVLLSGQSHAQETNRVTEWHEDLAYLVESIDSIHPDPFYDIPEAEFDAAVQALESDIPSLRDDEIRVRIMQLVSLLHDGHSGVTTYLPNGPFHYYPLRFYDFADGLYLLEAPDYPEAIGGQLVSINGRAAAEALALVGTTVAYDNPASQRLLATQALLIHEVLSGLNIIDPHGQPAYMVQMADGTRHTLNPPLLTRDEFNNRIIPSNGLPIQPEPLYLSNRTPFWMTYLENEQVVYVQYNQMFQSIRELRVELQAVIEANPVRRVVIDLRHNGGGDESTSYLLSRYINNDPFFQESGRLVVLIGRNTFSAAVILALRVEAQAVFIGEATGGQVRPFENNAAITLPNSRLEVRLATHRRADVPETDTRTAIEPDLAVPLTSTDFLAGLDPILAAALAWEP